MSAEKIRNGVKAKQVMSAIKQAKIQDMTIGGQPLSLDQKVKVICIYLKAWENIASFNFASSSKKEAGAAVAMAGLKYMLLLLPSVWERSVQQRKQFTTEFVEDVLKSYMSSVAIDRDRFFTCEENKRWFLDRTSIDRFANETVKKIKGLGNETFNPLNSL